MKENNTTVSVTSTLKGQRHGERYFEGVRVYTNDGPEELHSLVSEFEDRCAIYAWNFKLKSHAAVARAYSKIRNRIIHAFYAAEYDENPEDIKAAWSHKCGCSCGCSPGFKVRRKPGHGRLKHNNCNLYLQLDGADPKDVAKLKSVIEKAKKTFIEEIQEDSIRSKDIQYGREEYNLKASAKVLSEQKEYFNL